VLWKKARACAHGDLQDPMIRRLGAERRLGRAQPVCCRARDGGRPVRRRQRRTRGNRWVVVYGFAKNERANIDKDETEALKTLATQLLSLTAQAVTQATETGELIEVECDAQDQVPHPGGRA
jgi:hypothetical protein